MRNSLFMANPSVDWYRFGELTPYCGVFSSAGLERELTAGKKEELFSSGVWHMRLCFDIASRVFNFHPGGLALDFGCGVGRLTCAMAPHFSEVVGLDISPGMLAEARSESSRRGCDNIVYDLSTERSRLAPNTYDFVHSYLVLQHIPVLSGERIIEAMLTSLKTHGVGAIHLTYGHSQGAIATWFRKTVKNFLPLRAVANILRGRRWDYPVMQMNDYELSGIFNIFSAHGVNEVFTHRVDDWGTFGLFIFFRKTEKLSSWSNPRT